MTEDLRIVCDQCGGWRILHRRKVALPIRQISLSDWTKEIPAPKTEPGVLRTVAMVAECQMCHFAVEYTRMESS
jgi:hypothetical protein